MIIKEIKDKNKFGLVSKETFFLLNNILLVTATFTILLGMIALYILLGFVMDSLSMILLTVPIFWPIIMGLEGLWPKCI